VANTPIHQVYPQNVLGKGSVLTKEILELLLCEEMTRLEYRSQDVSDSPLFLSGKFSIRTFDFSLELNYLNTIATYLSKLQEVMSDVALSGNVSRPTL